MFNYLKLGDVRKIPNAQDRIAIVRVDFNSPVNKNTGELIDSPRIDLHTDNTIKALSRMCKGVVVLSHQGRKGQDDFISLKEHAKICERRLNNGIKVIYPWEDKTSDEVIAMGEEAVSGEHVKGLVKNLDPRSVLIIENVRFSSYELGDASSDYRKTPLISMLKESIKNPIVCFDGFSVSHRSHCSVVGLKHLSDQIYAGGVMDDEIRKLSRAIDNPQEPLVLICGGAKVPETLQVIHRLLKQNNETYVLTAGLVGLTFLWAQDIHLGKPTIKLLESKGLEEQLPLAKELLEKYKNKLETPDDLGYGAGGLGDKRREVLVENLRNRDMMQPIKDIGINTQIKYGRIILDAKTVVMNGAAGIYEEKEFEYGTSFLMKVIGSYTTYHNGFALLGGGDTITALKREPAEMIEGIHCSPSGKAFLKVISTGDFNTLQGAKMLNIDI